MFTLQQILTATQGKLICGGLKKKICGVSIDSRRINNGELFIAIKGERFDGYNFIQQAIDRGAAAVIFRSSARGKLSLALTSEQRGRRVGADRKVAFIRVTDTLRALGDIACYHRQRFDIPIVAVTGSSGKTTTKEMIAAVLKRKYPVLKNQGTRNNLIGIPLCLLKLESKHRAAVVEIGMSRFGEIARLTRILKPSLGVITNIGPSHLDKLKKLTAVAKAKAELPKNLDNDAAVILNKDDNFFEAMSERSNALALKHPGRHRQAQAGTVTRVGTGGVVTFGINKPANFRVTQYTDQNGKLYFIVNNRYPFFLKIPGEHNIYNALAGIAVCAQLNINYGMLMQGLASFSSLPLRGEVKKIGRVTIIDDGYNSNPQSLSSALRLLLRYRCRGKRILVIGDMLELGEEEKKYHTTLGKIIGNSNIDMLLTFGELSRFSAQAARREGMGKDSVFSCNNKHKLMEILLHKVSPGDVILVKGSRAMHMEEVTRCFITSYTL